MKKLCARCVNSKKGKCNRNDTGDGDVSMVIGIIDNQGFSAGKLVT
jgi:hypothetical protein